MAEKKYRVLISFDKPESNLFGGLGYQSVVVVVSESVKDTIVDEFMEQRSVITVNMQDSTVRYLNTRNILCIDVSEVQLEEKVSDEKVS